MKTSYLNPFGQNALSILQSFGNITRISQTEPHINEIITHTHNQDPKKIDTIQELCYEKIRYYYTRKSNSRTSGYTYLLSEELEEEDIISTHALLQAAAITYGSNSYEADTIINTITSILDVKLDQCNNEVMDETLNEYIDIHNTTLNDIIILINNNEIRLNELLLNKDKIILTYDDFLKEYSEHLKHRRPESIYQAICTGMKKHLIRALITEKLRNYMKTIEDKLKQIEPATIIKEIGQQIKTIQNTQQETLLKRKYGKNMKFTNFNDDKATAYMPEAFPPCIQKTLKGIKKGGRNYAITLFLTPFLSYARLYPGVYVKHIKNPKITDIDSTLNITQKEIIPLIYEAANKCKPPLFSDQPHEKQNINSKLGFGEGEIKHENSGKTPWYRPINCKNLKQQQPALCTPCEDCRKIGNPLIYYNRKRKLLIKSGGKK